MTRATAERASVAVSEASRRTRAAWRTLPTCQADCDSIVCTTRCYRRICISPAKMTFRVVTSHRWAVAVSSMPRHGGRHVRHYPAARADSHSLAVPRTRHAKCACRETVPTLQAFAALLGLEVLQKYVHELFTQSRKWKFPGSFRRLHRNFPKTQVST